MWSPMIYSKNKKDMSSRAMELLELVEMSERANHNPNELSGDKNKGWLLQGRWQIVLVYC